MAQATRAGKHMRLSGSWQAQRRDEALKQQAAQRQRLLDDRRQQAAPQMQVCSFLHCTSVSLVQCLPASCHTIARRAAVSKRSSIHALSGTLTCRSTQAMQTSCQMQTQSPHACPPSSTGRP